MYYSIAKKPFLLTSNTKLILKRRISSLNKKPFASLSIGIPKEHNVIDLSSCIDPESTKLFADNGIKVNVEKDTGEKSLFSDRLFEMHKGIIETRNTVFQSDLVFKSNPPTEEEIGIMKSGSALFCNYRNNSHNSIKLLESKNISVYNIDKICNGILSKYHHRFMYDKTHHGVVWDILSYTIKYINKPLPLLKEGSKICVVNVDGCNFISLYASMLELLGANYTLIDIDKLTPHNIGEFDIVVLPINVYFNAIEFDQTLFDSMKRGSVLIDCHHEDSGQFEKTYPGHTYTLNGKTIVGYDSSNVSMVDESIPILRGILLYKAIVEASNGKKIDIENEPLKRSKISYEEPKDMSKFLESEETENLMRSPVTQKETNIFYGVVLAFYFLLHAPMFYL